MEKNYKYHNLEGLYFVSFSVIKWLNVFMRNKYKDILVESLTFCQKNKGMEITSWCIMNNHAHLIFRSIKGQHPGLLLADFKRFTSKAVVKAIQENPEEKRKEFYLTEFAKAGAKSNRISEYKFWQHDNMPIELWSRYVTQQKINYTHQNPVKAGFVSKAEDYTYSSAIDYAGGQGLLKDIVIFR